MHVHDGSPATNCEPDGFMPARLASEAWRVDAVCDQRIGCVLVPG